MQWISHVASCQILMFPFDAVSEFSRTVATVLSVALLKSLMQSSEALIFYKIFLLRL